MGDSGGSRAASQAEAVWQAAGSRQQAAVSLARHCRV
jgi:hypothetical protein